jgi:type II secretory pathway component PulM
MDKFALWNKLKNWWSGLKQNEKIYVGIVGVLLGILLIYSILISPLNSAVDTLKLQVNAQQNLIVWMQPRTKALAGITMPKNAVPVTADMLLSTVDSRLKQTEWAGQNPDIRQVNGNGVRVNFTSAPTDALLEWLVMQWQQSQITVSQMDATRTDKPGESQVMMTLVAGN